jgi:hypothetical protein
MPRLIDNIFAYAVVVPLIFVGLVGLLILDCCLTAWDWANENKE